LFGHQTTKIPYSCEKKNIEELRADKEEKEKRKKR